MEDKAWDKEKHKSYVKDLVEEYGEQRVRCDLKRLTIYSYPPNHHLSFRRAGLVLVPSEDGYYDSERCLEDFDRVSFS